MKGTDFIKINEIELEFIIEDENHDQINGK